MGGIMVSTFKDNMILLSKAKTLDESLAKVVDESATMTRYELLKNSRENEQFKKFLELQSSIAKNAESYLSDSRTAMEKFKAFIHNPTGTGLQRLVSMVTLGWYKAEVTPQTVGNLVLDLYNAQTEHKSAVSTSLSLLKNRRELIYTSAAEAAKDITTNAQGYMGYKVLLDRVKGLKQVLDDYVKSGEVDTDALKKNLSICTDSGLYDGRDLLGRLTVGEDVKPDLYLVKNDIDRLLIDTDEKARDTGLIVKSATSILQGLDLQKDQYQATINGMAVQLSELTTDLKYTKISAQNTLMLAKAQYISNNALEGFLAYKDVMNQAQLFNSLGARVMLDRVGFLLTTPFFDPKVLDEARGELNMAVDLFNKNDQKFQSAITEFITKAGIDQGNSIIYNR